MKLGKIGVGILVCGLVLGGQAARAAHGIALGAALKYPANFTHFNYVNPAAPKGGTLRLSALGTFDSFNPFVVKGTPAAGVTPLYPSYLHATLLFPSHDEAFARYGYVAQDIELDPENRYVTYRLRPQARFHDGTPMTASDVAWTFKTLLAKGQPLFKAYYKDVSRVVVVDPHTVRFEFGVTTNRELPLILGEMPILSEVYFKKNPFEAATVTPPVGSGPYKVVEASPGHRVTYERVKNWWGEELPVHKGQNNFERIVYEYYRDQTVLFEAFKSGSYDFRLESVASNWAKGYDIAPVKEGKIKRIEVEIETPRMMQALIYNTRRPLFLDVRVREAFGYAYNFQWVNKTLYYGLYERLHSYFDGSSLAAKGLPEGEELACLEPFKAALPARVLTIPFTLPLERNRREERASLERASLLLKEAGYHVVDGKLIDPHTKAPVIFEILLSQEPVVKSLQNFLHNLKKLGVEANIRLVDSAQYEARVNRFDYDMIFAILPQSLSPGNEQREFWQSDRADLVGSRNYAGIKNPVVDALVEKIQQADTRAQLEARVRALDRVLLWNFYSIPLYASAKMRIAYWTHIAHPASFPRYSLGLESWWYNASLGDKP